MSAIAPNVSLDALFRRNATMRGDLCALCDLDGTALTYTEVSNAVANVTEQIAAFGLQPKSAIALLLPNGRELIVATLAVLRSGHVPVPMPVVWRKSDLVRGCREAEAAALITTAHYNGENLPELVAQVAIEVFELSFPCAFGSQLPDGLSPLPFNVTAEPLLAKTSLSDIAAAGIATLQPASGGVSFVFHSNEELLAAGLGAMLAGDVRGGDTIISAISFATFAGLTAAFVPWLLNSGTLTLLPELPPKGTLAFDKNTHLIAASGALADLAAIDRSALASAFAVHFAGVKSATVFPALNASTVVDVLAIDELAAIALPRVERGTPSPLPLGAIHAGNTGAGSPVTVETRVVDGLLQVRGAMIPKDALREQEWLETGYAADMRDASSAYIRPPIELFTIGALRFNFHDLERRVRAAALVSDVHVKADPILGFKLVIESERPEETSRALLNAGLPRIIAGSVQKAEAVRAKAS